jgi:hypothetical protein
MNIARYELLSEDDLLSRIKATRLKGFGQPEVYRDATLEIVEQVDPNTLAPAQNYVLAPSVQTIVSLFHAFTEQGIDIFALRGGLLFWQVDENGEEEGPIPLIPPMVEESIEADGRTVRIINDGMHRVYAARELGRSINIVLAHNVPPEYPYYAYALPNGWAEVEKLDEIPDVYQKKAYRNPDDYKALFRNFNEVLPGVQKQRKQSNPSHVK